MLKILVIRNDKLGDFMLAWPALSLLKSQYPSCHVSVLVPAYTAPMAELCPWIDKVLIDKRQSSKTKDISNLFRLIKNENFDVSINLFLETRTAIALWLARVPKRFGPATKIAQVYLNNKLLQRRSQSAKPEFEYNTDLVRFFISTNNDNLTVLPTPPYLSFQQQEITRQKKNYYQRHKINSVHKLVCIHPGTGGSATNLSLEQFSQLARILSQDNKLHFVITAGPDELEIAKSLSELMTGLEHTIYHSTDGLVNFCQFIAISDLFISGSTGPLHIAGALDIPTAAFYSARRSATALRWQTLNRDSQRIAISPIKYKGDNDMKTLDIPDSAQQIHSLLRQSGCADT